MPQVRDEFRTDFDADRGGYGRVVAQQLTTQNTMWQQVQLGAGMGAAATAAVNPVFFGQQQRGPEQMQQQQRQDQQPADEAVVAAPDGKQEADADEDVAVNPRLKGRGREQEEEEEEEYARDSAGPRKKQRVTGPSAPQEELAEASNAADMEPDSEAVQQQELQGDQQEDE